MVRAIFFDRDGVINEVIDRGEDCFVSGKKVRFTGPWKYEELKIKENINDLFKKLKKLGFLIVLITNQPDVKYGMLSKYEYDRIMGDIKNLHLDDIFVCLHGRDDGCLCKKPKPGMLLNASEKHNIDLKSSFMIGDTCNDMAAAKDAGCASVLLSDGINDSVDCDFRVSNIHDIIDIVVGC